MATKGLDVAGVLDDGIADYEESGNSALADDVREVRDAVALLAACAEAALAYVDEAAHAERERHKANGAPHSLVVAQVVADNLRAALARCGGA